MQNLLRRYKKYGAFEDFMTEEWSEKVEEGISKCTEKIAYFEALKKATEARVDEIKFFTLKELIREKYGKEEFILLMDELEREVKAYHLQEMAQVKNYVHSEGGSLAKLNK